MDFTERADFDSFCGSPRSCCGAPISTSQSSSVLFQLVCVQRFAAPRRSNSLVSTPHPDRGASPTQCPGSYSTILYHCNHVGHVVLTLIRFCWMHLRPVLFVHRIKGHIESHWPMTLQSGIHCVPLTHGIPASGLLCGDPRS